MMLLAVFGLATLLALIWAMHWSTNLLVPAPCSWWRRNRQGIMVVGVLITSGASLIIALANDCRYLCQQWQSTGLDLLATISGFWLGMILARALDSPKTSPNYWANVGLWLTGLLVFATVLVLILLFLLSDATLNSFVIFIWALGLPVLGVAARWRWPWLF